MGDLKVSEGFLDAVMIRKTSTNVAGTVLTVACSVMKLSDGTTTSLTVEELTLGVYKVTNWTPAADTEYITIWSVTEAGYTIYAAYKLFKVGGGRIEDIYDAVKAGGTGDLAAILLDTGTTIPASITALSVLLTPEIADILADVTGLNGDVMRGTDSAATVADGWDSALATILDNFSSTRIGYLDNINNANLSTIADISSLTATEIGYLNTSISSRAPSSEYDTEMARITANVALASVLGALTDSAVQDADATTATVQSLIKGIHDVLWDADGLTAWEVAAAPGANVGFSAVIRSIYNDTDELQSDNIPGVISTHDSKLDVVDGYHDVATANAVTNAVMSDVIGNKTDAAIQDGDATQKSIMALLKGVHDVIWDADGITAWGAAAVPGTGGVSLSEALRYIYSEQLGTEFDGSPDLYDAIVTGYATQGVGSATGSVIERLNILLHKDVNNTYDRTTDSQEALREALDVVDGFHDVAVANAETNTVMSDVIGNKTDTASIDVTGIKSNNALLKGIISTLHGVSTPDEVTNLRIKHVLGNKADTAAVSILDTNSLMRYMKGALGATWTAESLKAIYDLLDAILDLTETGGTLTATGAEDTIYISNAPSGVWEPRTVSINLSLMQAGDTVQIKIYERNISGGALTLVAGGPLLAYTAVQSISMFTYPLNPNRYGAQITLEQTAGVNRNYPWEVFYSG